MSCCRPAATRGPCRRPSPAAARRSPRRPAHSTVCNIPDAPLASAIGETTTGQTYSVEWTTAGDSTTYELQESADASFTNPAVFTVSGTSQSFTKSVTTATPFFYRVHAISTCAAAPFSPVISVVVVPLPSPTDPRFNVAVPNGSTTPVVFRSSSPASRAAPSRSPPPPTSDWISVLPQAGIVPPNGTFLTVSLDPSQLAERYLDRDDPRRLQHPRLRVRQALGKRLADDVDPGFHQPGHADHTRQPAGSNGQHAHHPHGRPPLRPRLAMAERRPHRQPHVGAGELPRHVQLRDGRSHGGDKVDQALHRAWRNHRPRRHRPAVVRRWLAQ